jgi:hypothetical protein
MPKQGVLREDAALRMARIKELLAEVLLLICEEEAELLAKPRRKLFLVHSESGLKEGADRTLECVVVSEEPE